MEHRGRLLLCATLCTLSIALASPRPSSAQVLSLISESDEDGISFWWSNPEEPAFSALDRALIEADDGLFVDPASVDPAPRVSRVHQVSDPPSSSVLNLGRLYGANHVLAGSLELGPIEATASQIGIVATATLSYRLVAVESQVTQLEVSRTFVGIGASSSELSALDDVRRQVAVHLNDRLRGVLSGATIMEDDVSTEPTLLIRDLESATPLVALLGELRGRSTVVADLHEVWATEGAVAVQVELQPGQPMSALDAVIAELGGVADWEYNLIVTGRDGLTIDVRIEPVVEEMTPSE